MNECITGEMPCVATDSLARIITVYSTLTNGSWIQFRTFATLSQYFVHNQSGELQSMKRAR